MSRAWVYPMAINGRFTKIRRWVAVVLMPILFVTPWVNIGGHPALHIDLPQRNLYVFGAMFTPNDTYFLVLIGLFTAFSLFFVTALFGRLWCGYACPQTVFLEMWVRPIEKLIEGDRSRRMQRDKGPWTFDKAWRKAAKWTAFAAMSIVTSMTVVSYFSSAVPLWTGQSGAVSYSFVGALSFLGFWDLAWFREQFCNYLCPYARFQGALADDHSLVIAYDQSRESDCIECKKCVAVCPNGIDIRNGFQLECISCGRCIDACEPVMGKFQKPNLVGYTTVAQTRGEKTHILRPRTIAYSILMAGILVTFGLLLTGRDTIAATVNRPPGPLYIEDADGYIRNTFLLHVENHDPQNILDGVMITVDGLPTEAEVTVNTVDLPPEGKTTVPLIIRVPAAQTHGPVPIHVIVNDPDGQRLSLKTTFHSKDS